MCSRQVKVTIQVPEGTSDVPAKKFDFCELFAVVMPQFGVFGVTHIASGCSLILGLEREKNAEEHLLKLHKASIEAAIPSNADTDTFKKIANNAGKLKALNNMTISEYCSVYRNRFYGSEFPWEFGSDCPHTRVNKLIRELCVSEKQCA